ncbi:IQ motif-containing GTPase-activating protein 3 [Ataeniobius toweri]|uniref:IQ motif-containing GTPase-activating protein 3 n=1 Tax=Ataeniobius toweri TaxID=208326 RepID=A0ABU7CJU5_9TELE|nr:IQ motif-containing GTPase-activating protein 3 [Ataeniobius toweri]
MYIDSVLFGVILAQEVVSSVSALYSRRVMWRSSEALIVCLQACCRGFLIRQQLEVRQRYVISQTPAVIIIQSHWKRFIQQRAYRQRLQFLYRNWRFVVKIQSFVKMWLIRRRYLSRLRFFSQNVDAVIKIQAFFRANRARHEYRMLVHSDSPPLPVVRKFLHLLELGDGDIREEAELLRLREEVVRSIRFNRQLESDLDLMDLKIGLLVRNRATLQEVVSHCKKLTKKNKEQLSDMMDVERSKGLKALSRDRRERLEAYQHLFYLLQTQPLYLAKVIFLMPQSRSTAFMEMVVFSLFNYGSDRREAFLLLQLFTEALQYEIRQKVEQPQDVITGNPTIIKMLVNFYRHAQGQNALRESLGPALQDVLLDQTLSIRTDPLEVYKTWINQTETQTGHKSCLPYEVQPEDALSHPEVQRRIDIAIINLKNLTDRVLKAITSNLNKLPYGLRYTAKVLRDALKTKFPAASESELYKRQPKPGLAPMTSLGQILVIDCKQLGLLPLHEPGHRGSRRVRCGGSVGRIHPATGATPRPGIHSSHAATCRRQQTLPWRWIPCSSLEPVHHPDPQQVQEVPVQRL